MAPGVSANVEKDGRSQVWEQPSPSPPIRLFLSPPLPPLSSCFHPQVGGDRPQGSAKGHPGWLLGLLRRARPQKQLLCPWGRECSPSLQLEQHPLKCQERPRTTPPRLASPSQKRHSLGDWLERQAAPPQSELTSTERAGGQTPAESGPEAARFPLPPPPTPRKGTAHVCFHGPSANSSDPTELLPTLSA